MTTIDAEAPVATFDSTLPDAVNSLTQAVADVDTLSLAYLREHPDDEVALLAFLAAVRAQRMRLAAVEASLEADAVRAMTGDRIEIVGIGVFERHGGTTRKEWDHDGLARSVVQAALVNPDGTMPDEDTLQTAFHVRDVLLQAAAVTYWRVGALKAMAIDVNNYCQRSPGRRTIQVTFAEAAGA